jgi:hypothetical protein
MKKLLVLSIALLFVFGASQAFGQTGSCCVYEALGVMPTCYDGLTAAECTTQAGDDFLDFNIGFTCAGEGCRLAVYGYMGTDFGGGAKLADTLIVKLNDWNEISVFLCGDSPDVYGADMNFAFGINTAICDTLTGIDFSYPFSEWDKHEFKNYNYDFITDWDCLSAVGFTNLINDDNPWFNATVPAEAFSMDVRTVNEPSYIGEYFCDAIGPGRDPFQGWPNMGDTLAGVGYVVHTFAACLFFSPNQAPTITPFDLPTDCTYEDFVAPFDVMDPDGDALIVTSTAGTVVLVGQTPDGDAITYHYELVFDMEDYCGECFNDDVIITADDENNDPVTYNAGNLTILGKMTASMDPALYIWPGFEEWMPVMFDPCGPCFCLGGFVFTIYWDASILEVTDVMAGDILLTGEYWNVVYNVAGPGTIRVVFFNEHTNQEPAPPICFDQMGEPPFELFKLKFLLNPEYQYDVNYCTPICFLNEYPTWTYNAVTDQDGYHIWFDDGCTEAPPDSIEYGTMFLELICGNIKVMNEHNVVHGDLNWNGYPFEIGDVVLFANHLIDPVGYPFNLRQMFASDVNGDGLQATIADLIYMINVLNFGPGAGKVAPLDVIASVSMPADTYGDVDVRITSEASVGGAVVSINHTGVELGVPYLEGMNVEYSDNGDVMTVLVYNLEGNAFASGTNVLFTVPVLSEGNVTITDVAVSNNQGALLDARAEMVAPIPTDFSVAQNFPNPFNAKTSIKFGLPTDADVTVDIYNVAGQLVNSMDLGHLYAGHHSVVWDASDVASGVYFYKVSAADFTKTMKMTLLK